MGWLTRWDQRNQRVLNKHAAMDVTESRWGRRIFVADVVVSLAVLLIAMIVLIVRAATT